MLQRKIFSAAALFVALFCGASNAEEVKIKGGKFVFLHDPVVVPPQEEWSLNPLGFSVHVESDAFDGSVVVTKGKNLVFLGSGTAEGFVFLAPENGVVAEFSGVFTWCTADGELHGTFEAEDYPTNDPSAFDVVICIKFQGGTGKFCNAEGEAFAVGSDHPFGGLKIGPNTFAGVKAKVIEGRLKF